MSDLDRVLAWTKADEHFLDRVTAQYPPERREFLKAIIETRGDVTALSSRLAPEALARIKQHLPAPVIKLAHPLLSTWAAPTDVSPEQIAQLFFERFGVRLDELTGHATKVAAAAKSTANAFKTASSASDAADAVEGIGSSLEALTAAIDSCTHPEGQAWKERAASIAGAGVDAVDAGRTLFTNIQAARAGLVAFEETVREWIAAPPNERASTAGSLAVHMRAAGAVANDLKEQIAAVATR